MRFLYLFLAAGPALFAQIIVGTVVNSVTGLPIGGVTVSIETAGRPAYQAATDDQGAFRVEGVKDGQYTANFRKTEYLAPDRQALPKPFRVTAGDPVRIQGQLTPLPKVSGRVFDGADHPVGGAELLLDGSQIALTKTSDVQGNFSFQIAPGTYMLSAKPPSDLKPPAAPEGERMGWVHTYYPGVVDPRAAVKVTVRAGIDLWGQDIQLRVAPLRRVRGVVIDAKGDPALRVAVKAALTDESLSEEMVAVSGDDGGFEFAAIHDGEWRVSAEMDSGGVKLRAFDVAQVAGRDQDRVTLRLAAPFTLRGSVSLGEVTGSKQEKKGIAVFLRPQVPASEALSQAKTDQDGSFKMERVYPGSYKIIAVSPGPPQFLSSILIGDRELLGQYVELTSGVLPLRIAFDSKGGGVRGSVDDCGGATVVLMPSDKSLLEPQFVQSARCTEAGRFELTGVRPGDYYAFAFDKWEGPLDLVSSFDQSLVNKAVTAHVQKGEVITVDLRVTSR